MILQVHVENTKCVSRIYFVFIIDSDKIMSDEKPIIDMTDP